MNIVTAKCDQCGNTSIPCIQFDYRLSIAWYCLACLRAAVQMLERHQEPKTETIICWWCRKPITDDDPGRTIGDGDQEHIRECEYKENKHHDHSSTHTTGAAGIECLDI